MIGLQHKINKAIITYNIFIINVRAEHSEVMNSQHIDYGTDLTLSLTSYFKGQLS